MSVLERMYTYAKAVGAGARENFTTEALAGAIRADPDPFVDFLHDAGHLPVGPFSDLDLDTQVVLPGTGILDLVLVCAIAGKRHELWLEIKVLAGESGRQLDAYRDHLARIPAELRPRLVVLGRRPIRDSADVAFVSWHDLRRKVERGASPAWRDFAQYLTEIRMSHDFDEPVGADEASALGEFRLVHGKISRIIFEAATQASKRWPSLPWPTREERIRTKTLERLATHEQLLVGVPPANVARGIWLTFGVNLRGGESNLEVAVETWPSAFDTQTASPRPSGGCGVHEGMAPRIRIVGWRQASCSVGRGP